MKIDRRRPGHWLLLLGLLFQGVVALVLRITSPERRDGTVVLYGHKLNGNLLALYRHMQGNTPDLRPVFLTMDAAYHRDLRASGVASIWVGAMECARHLAKASALISDHGLHSLGLLRSMYRRSGMLFFDVWHAIPFKGFDADDFHVQHHYDGIWVASELCRHIYVTKYGFDPRIVSITGYARTDQLVLGTPSSPSREDLGIPRDSRIVLFAPTWAQDSKGRSIYPFGCPETEFLELLSSISARHGATILVRSHLNSGDPATDMPPGIIALPSSRFPDTESILSLSDVLVCDWSSIAFDFLLLDRPAIFLDVPAPFRKGFSLDPTYRYGPVVSDLGEMTRQIELCLQRPDLYWAEHGSSHRVIREQVYGPHADGHASERCVERLRHCLDAARGREQPPL